MTDFLEIDLSVDCPDWTGALPGAEALCRRAVLSTWEVAAEGTRPAEVSVVLSDDAAVRVLNRDYRGKDRPTNVLSFAALDDAEGAPDLPEDAPLLLGDIVIAWETTAREAGEAGKSLSDHFSHLLVHGMLHLMGYDHMTDQEAEEMEALEVQVLSTLGISDPYADPAS